MHVVDHDRARLAAYSRVCGYPLNDRLPMTWPHVLGFPLQMSLMSARDFPFALPGLVHLRNEIEWAQPLPVSQPLVIEVHAEQLAEHPRGATVDLVTEVRVGDALGWSGRSTYLSLGRSIGTAVTRDELAVAVDDRARSVWHVPADIGRRYARVSGDVNPIHVSRLAAKAFGFPRAIAHGMWLQARLLSSYGSVLPSPGRCVVEFRAPVLLPSTVRVHERRAGLDGWDVELRSSADRVHLGGVVRRV